MWREPGFLGVLASGVALGLGSSFVSPFLSLWGTQWVGLTPFWFGLFMTTTSLAAILVSTSLARWSDTHLPRKLVLLIAALAGVIGYSGYALVRDPLVLVAIGVSALAVASMAFSQLFAYTRERFALTHDESLSPGVLMGLVRASFALAWTGGPALGAWVQASFGFRGLFLGAAGLYLAFLFGVLKCVQFEPRSEAVRRLPRVPVWRELTRGDVCTVFVAFLLVFAAHTMNAMNMPLTIVNVLGGRTTDVGIAYCVGPFVEIPLMVWFGHVAARHGSLGLIRFGAAITVVYFLALHQARAPEHVWLAQILSGVSFAILSNVAILLFQDLLPGQPGLGTTIYANATQLGSLAGYLGFGTLVQAFGNRGVFLIAAALSVLTFAIMMAYRPRRLGTSA